jgi:hypothetical protein
VGHCPLGAERGHRDCCSSANSDSFKSYEELGVTGAGPYTIYGRIFDEDGGYQDYSSVLGIAHGQRAIADDNQPHHHHLKKGNLDSSGAVPILLLIGQEHQVVGEGL